MNGLNNRSYYLPLLREGMTPVPWKPLSTGVDNWATEPVLTDSSAEQEMWQGQGFGLYAGLRFGSSGRIAVPVPVQSLCVAPVATPPALPVGADPSLPFIPCHLAPAAPPCFPSRRTYSVSKGVSLASDPLVLEAGGAGIPEQQLCIEEVLEKATPCSHAAYRSEGGGTMQHLSRREQYKPQPYGPWSGQQAWPGPTAASASLTPSSTPAAASTLHVASQAAASSAMPGPGSTAAGDPGTSSRGGDLLMADATLRGTTQSGRRSSAGCAVSSLASGRVSPGLLDVCCSPLKRVSLVDPTKGASSPVRAAGSPIAVQRTPTKHTASTGWSPFAPFPAEKRPSPAAAAAAAAAPRARDPSSGGGTASLAEQRRMALSSVSNLAQLRNTVAEDAQLPPRDKQGLLQLIDQALKQQQQQQKRQEQQPQGQGHQTHTQSVHPIQYPTNAARCPPGPGAAVASWHAAAAAAAFEAMAGCWHEPMGSEAQPATPATAAATSPSQPHQSPQQHQPAGAPSGDVQGCTSAYGGPAAHPAPYPLPQACVPAGGGRLATARATAAPSDGCSQGSTATGLSDFAQTPLSTMGSVPESGAPAGGGAGEAASSAGAAPAAPAMAAAAAGKGWSALRSGAVSPRGATLCALSQQRMAPLDVRRMGLGSPQQQQQQQPVMQPEFLAAAGVQPASSTFQNMHPENLLQQQTSAFAVGGSGQQQLFAAQVDAWMHPHPAQAAVAAMVPLPLQQGAPCRDAASASQLPATNSALDTPPSHDPRHPCTPQSQQAGAQAATPPEPGSSGAAPGPRAAWHPAPRAHGYSSSQAPEAVPYTAAEGGPGESVGLHGIIAPTEEQCMAEPVFREGVAAAAADDALNEVLGSWLGADGATKEAEPYWDLDAWLVETGSPNPYV